MSLHFNECVTFMCICVSCVGGLGEGVRVHLCTKLQWRRGVAPWALVRVCCVLDRQAAVTFPVGGFFRELGVGWGGGRG